MLKSGQGLECLAQLANEYVATAAAPTKAEALLKDGGHLSLLLRSEEFLQALLTHVRPRVVEVLRTASL